MFKLMMPPARNKYVHVMAWISLAVQIGIVVTGGAVRLTASGLGCPQWPTCDGSSIVTTPEMGIHGLIEFGNRLLTFVLVIIAVLTFLSVVRWRKISPQPFWLSLFIGLGIPLQAVVGGISVLVTLNPYVVGLHFVISGVLISLATLLVLSTRKNAGSPAQGIVPRSVFAISWVMLVAESATVLLGILTTGSGPHAGDASAPRNDLDTVTIELIHKLSAYSAFISVVVLLVVSMRFHVRALTVPITFLFVVNVCQIAVGIAQSISGLPPVLVGLHMLFACLVISGATNVVARACGIPTPKISAISRAEV